MAGAAQRLQAGPGDHGEVAQGLHVDRDAQFGYLNAAVVEHLAIGALVVSVDTKKKELVGEFYNGGPQEQVAASRCSRRFGVRPRRSQSAAGLDSAEEHLDHEADDKQVEDHLRDDDLAGRLAGRRDVSTTFRRPG